MPCSKRVTDIALQVGLTPKQVVHFPDGMKERILLLTKGKRKPTKEEMAKAIEDSRLIGLARMKRKHSFFPGRE